MQVLRYAGSRTGEKPDPEQKRVRTRAGVGIRLPLGWRQEDVFLGSGPESTSEARTHQGKAWEQT